MSDLYYTAPPDEIFEEVKQKAIEIWSQYDNTYGYVDEKVGRIKDMKNIKDNVMYIVAMFDSKNQALLARTLSYEARKAVADRIKAGGAPDNHNLFLDLN